MSAENNGNNTTNLQQVWGLGEGEWWRCKVSHKMLFQPEGNDKNKQGASHFGTSACLLLNSFRDSVSLGTKRESERVCVSVNVCV